MGYDNQIMDLNKKGMFKKKKKKIKDVDFQVRQLFLDIFFFIKRHFFKKKIMDISCGWYVLYVKIGLIFFKMIAAL